MKRLTASLCFAFSISPLYAQGVGYVVDNARPQVAVVDLGSRRVSATIPSGSQASEILILPNNHFAFVSNQGENNVALLDLYTNSRAATVPVGQAPGSLAATPDGRFLYVASEGSNDVTVLNTAAVINNTPSKVAATIPVGTTPVNVNLSPNGKFAYAVNQDDGTVSVIDTGANQVLRTLTVGQRPNQIAIAANLNTAYVVNSASSSLTLVDLSQNQVIGAPLAVGSGPAIASFSADGRRLYVLNRNSGSVSVVDTQPNRVIAQITVGPQPADIAITSDSKFAYVSNQGSNTVSLLDLTTNTNEGDVMVGSGPFSVRFDPNEDFLFVTNLGSSSLSVVDVNVDRVVATVGLGLGAAPVQFELLNAPTLLQISPNPAAAGSLVTLKGEGFLPSSTVRLVTTSPPQTLTPAVTFVDSETLQVRVPSFSGAAATVFVANPDGSSSEELTFQIGTPAVSIFAGGVVEGAGFQRAPYPISGNSIVSVFGNFPGVVQQSAQGFPLPTTLGNATVTFNGVSAPLIFVSPDQINLVAPVGLLNSTSAQAVASVLGQSSAPQAVNVAPAAPGIFTFPAGGTLTAFTNAAGQPVTSGRRGETLVMYVTGLGNTNPPPVDGQPARSDVLSPATATPTVLVGGTPATVSFSGLTPGFSGLYQINFDVPPSLAPGSVSVTVTSSGHTGNSVALTVQ